MGIFRHLAIFIVLAAFLFLGTACSSKEPSNQLTGAAKKGQPVAESEQQPAKVAQEKLPGVQPEQAEKETPAAEPKTLAVTGTLAQAGDEIMLVTDLGDYVIVGQDLSALVGKSVNVTGAVEEAEGKYTINVLSFTEN